MDYGTVEERVRLKLKSVGKSIAVILPKQFLRRLNVKKGDFLFAVETPEGCLLMPYDPEVAEDVKLGRRIMAKHRKTLRALAEQ